MKIITHSHAAEKQSTSVEYSINTPVNASDPYTQSVAANLIEAKTQENSLIGGIL
ncbi:hypothetical protein ACL6C3_14890 [Capilliphycus salinus ALCB114379]|uniref:hypothetical protein n=1 Tax=Capilliphycus salinus TaxID=2768948 RepID=UPI0039A5D346